MVPSAWLADDPDLLLRTVDELGDFALIAAPSGYGLPLVRGEHLDDRALRLAFLSPSGEPSGVLGLRRAVRRLVGSRRSLVFLPGVVHLAGVPAHRKVNRIDLGTADKLCAAAAAVAGRAEARRLPPREVSLLLAELGGAFTATLAIRRGAIVDGAGGTSGSLGFRAAGALDGEVAVLADTWSKDDLFSGGAISVAGDPDLTPERWPLAAGREGPGRAAWLAFVEGVVKALAGLRVSAPEAAEVVVSGRLAGVPELVAALRSAVRDALDLDLVGPAPEPNLTAGAGQAALGAALLADGLSGGRHAALVEALGVLDAGGTALDHLYLPAARRGALRLLEGG